MKDRDVRGLEPKRKQARMTAGDEGRPRPDFSHSWTSGRCSQISEEGDQKTSQLERCIRPPQRRGRTGVPPSPCSVFSKKDNMYLLQSVQESVHVIQGSDVNILPSHAIIPADIEGRQGDARALDVPLGDRVSSSVPGAKDVELLLLEGGCSFPRAGQSRRRAVGVEAVPEICWDVVRLAMPVAKALCFELAELPEEAGRAAACVSAAHLFGKDQFKGRVKDEVRRHLVSVPCGDSLGERGLDAGLEDDEEDAAVDRVVQVVEALLFQLVEELIEDLQRKKGKQSVSAARATTDKRLRLTSVPSLRRSRHQRSMR